MNEQQVRNILKAEGYTDIEGLRLEFRHLHRQEREAER